MRIEDIYRGSPTPDDKELALLERLRRTECVPKLRVQAKDDALQCALRIAEFLMDRDGPDKKIVALFIRGNTLHTLMHQAFLRQVGVEELVIPVEGNPLEIRSFGSAKLVAEANYTPEGVPAYMDYVMLREVEPVFPATDDYHIPARTGPSPEA